MWLKRYLGTKPAALDQLGKLESEVMERIWERGEVSVRHLHQDLSGRLAYTTVMTTLDRLYKKRLLQRRKVGKAYFYVPAFTEQEYHERVAQHLFGIVLHDGANNQAALSSFVDVVSQKDNEMLDRLEKLVKAKRRALRRPE